jgi:rubrerythrin
LFINIFEILLSIKKEVFDKVIYFKPSEIAKIAMKVEKNGLAFYETLAKRAKEGEAKTVFSFMAKEEATHYATFEKLGDRFASYEVPEGFGDDYDEYMQQLVNSNVFASDINAVELAGKVNTPLEAIDLALGFEKDSIVFFGLFKKILPPEEQFTVEELMDEEYNHIKKLLQIKKDITETREEFYITKGDWDSERQ